MKRYARAFLAKYPMLDNHDMIQLMALHEFLLRQRPSLQILDYASMAREQKVARIMAIVARQCPDLRALAVQALETLIQVLSMRCQLVLLPAILELVVRRFYATKPYELVEVTTACPLTAPQQEEVIEHMHHLTGKTVSATFSVDPALIAGLRIVGKQALWQMTVAQKVKNLRFSGKR